jgi:hypothetical protein
MVKMQPWEKARLAQEEALAADPGPGGVSSVFKVLAQPAKCDPLTIRSLRGRLTPLKVRGRMSFSRQTIFAVQTVPRAATIQTVAVGILAADAVSVAVVAAVIQGQEQMQPPVCQEAPILEAEIRIGAMIVVLALTVAVAGLSQTR